MKPKVKYEKRPAIGTRIMIRTESRIGVGKVVGHVELKPNGVNHRSPFLVSVTRWKERKPEKVVNIQQIVGLVAKQLSEQQP